MTPDQSLSVTVLLRYLYPARCHPIKLRTPIRFIDGHFLSVDFLSLSDTRRRNFKPLQALHPVERGLG
jgi:hypothetical protein